MPNSRSNPLIRKLEGVLDLTDGERDVLLRLPERVMDIRADQDLVREGDRPSRSFLLLEGFCCTFKVTGDGKRQIMAFHVPGDLPDLHSLHLDVLDMSVSTITPARVGFIPHESLRHVCERHPRIASALWRDTLIDASVFREWMVNVGRRPAIAGLAHILCEMVVRLRAVGLAEGHSCELPITQSELGDALGLSAVHVNRTLQEIRDMGLIEWRGGRLTVLDWERLRQVGDFDPTYLHLEGEAAE